MRIRLATVAGLFLTASPGLAQDPDSLARMFPLAPGDRWEYAITRYWLAGDSMEVETGERERWAVLEATVQGDTATALVEQVRWAADGTERPGALCRVTRRLLLCTGCQDYLMIDVRSEQGRCTVPGVHLERAAAVGSFPVREGYAWPEPYLIGGIPYDLEISLANDINLEIGQPFPEILVTSFWLSGRDVGMLFARWDHARPNPDGWTRECKYELVYAEVGGVTYGVPPRAEVASPMEVPEAFGLKAAYPNPFREALTLRIVQPRAEPVTVEVFDLLGRRVLRAEMEEAEPGTWVLAIDGRVLASGTYVVRATTASGASATRRVVRAE
jgi:hypothetical protein